MKKPKIFHQAEKSFHCGGCCVASVLDYFDEIPESIPLLQVQLAGENAAAGDGKGIWSSNIQSYFLRKDWICLVNSSGPPCEYSLDEKKYPKQRHEYPLQRIATWHIVNQMLKDGYLCILEYKTAAESQHFAIVYDAFIRRNIYWFRMACSGQGYFEAQVENFLNCTGYNQIFIKPPSNNNEYR